MRVGIELSDLGGAPPAGRPRWLIARMVANTFQHNDWRRAAVGRAFDVTFRANMKNMALLSSGGPIIENPAVEIH